MVANRIPRRHPRQSLCRVFDAVLLAGSSNTRLETAFREYNCLAWEPSGAPADTKSVALKVASSVSAGVADNELGDDRVMARFRLIPA